MKWKQAKVEFVTCMCALFMGDNETEGKQGGDE